MIALVAASTALKAETAPSGQTGDAVSMEAFAVTANRSLQPLSAIPQRIEIVSGAAIEDSPSWTMADVLKKSTSLDVIQYPSGLAGVGIRGFRPEFSGTNQHVLVLIDGNPAGVTSLGNLPMIGFERIEVLKGPASSLYGASAMGGVVNLITRRSSGQVRGNVEGGVGSFGTYEGGLQVGGGNPEKLDFDVAVRAFERTDDQRLGNGEERPNTQLSMRSAFGRVGRKLGADWRVDLKAGGYLGRDIENPGAYSDGTSAQNSKDIDQYLANLQLQGLLGDHAVQANAYRSHEYDKTHTETTGVVPYVSNIRETNWTGGSLQDSWKAGSWLQLTGGGDYQKIETRTKTYSATHARKAPSTPDNTQTTKGVYLEGVTKLFDDKLAFNVGARYDDIELEVRPTPYNTALRPGSQSFDTFNPRAGLNYKLPAGLRAHATAGRAFVAPAANQIAGSSDEVVSGQRRVSSGNPDLGPETAKSWDLGLGWEKGWLAVDLTYFDTKVSDKIESVYVTNTSTYRETSYVNASRATQRGLEAKLDADLGAAFGLRSGLLLLDASGTRMLDRDQYLPDGASLIRNVADLRLNAGLSARYAGWRARVSTRYAHGQWDQDNSKLLIYTGGKGGLFEYSSYLVWDASLARRYWKRHETSLIVENFTDRFYYEKGDYPQPGVSFFVRHRIEF